MASYTPIKGSISTIAPRTVTISPYRYSPASDILVLLATQQNGSTVIRYFDFFTTKYAVLYPIAEVDVSTFFVYCLNVAFHFPKCVPPCQKFADSKMRPKSQLGQFNLYVPALH